MRRPEPRSAEYDDRLVIIHADMDAFYAAVEVLDDPSLRGKPLIIGHPGRRGVVATASYEARKFGVHSAMPSAVAKRKCPHAEWRPGRGRRYVEVSRQIRDVFEHFTPLVEPLSLDEAFLDVRGSLLLFGGAIAIAEELRERVHRETGGLTVSVGVAENKFLAKIASDLQKPDGLTVVPPGNAQAFLSGLPIRKLWGVGPKSAERLERLGLRKISDLVRVGREFLERELGKNSGAHLWALSHGRDERRVVSSHAAKSISTESTFGNDLRDADQIRDFLFQASDQVAESLRKEGVRARTVQLKLRTGDFTTFTRSKTLDHPTDLPSVVYAAVIELLETRIELRGRGVRLLGVGGKGLVENDDPVQGDLFDQSSSTDRVVSELADRVNESLGTSAVQRGRKLKNRRSPLDGRLSDDDPSRQK